MTNTLTKSQIIDTVAKDNGYSKKKSVETVETLIKIIKRTLESGADAVHNQKQCRLASTHGLPVHRNCAAVEALL